jgi:hypothetical protein
VKLALLPGEPTHIQDTLHLLVIAAGVSAMLGELSLQLNSYSSSQTNSWVKLALLPGVDVSAYFTIVLGERFASHAFV